MGTALLSILCGHWRYAHINSVRGDAVNAGLLGMARIVSEVAPVLNSAPKSPMSTGEKIAMVR